MMDEIIAEIRALGAWCIIHGPEAWLGIAGISILSGGVVLGMWLAALLGANREEDDDEQ